jgi:hypothetical protein
VTIVPDGADENPAKQSVTLRGPKRAVDLASSPTPRSSS